MVEVTLSPLQEIAINGSLRTNERVEALYRLLRAPLLEVNGSYKGIDCEATATDTWTNVLSDLGAFVMPETVTLWTVFQGWGYRIATNGATDQWRREQFRRSALDHTNTVETSNRVDP